MRKTSLVYTTQISALWTSSSEINVLRHPTTMISSKLYSMLFLLARNKADFRRSSKRVNNGASPTASKPDKLLYTLVVPAFEPAELCSNTARSI